MADLVYTALERLRPPRVVGRTGYVVRRARDKVVFAFLESLTADPGLRGKELVATTPNATALYNVVLALARRESMHRDHLHVFSYKTLTTLCRRAGLESWTIVPYHATFPEMRLQGTRLQRVAVIAHEGAIGAAERVFPLLAGGYIVDAII